MYFFERWYSRFRSKTQWQTFLLVSGRHVGAYLDGRHHDISIRSSTNLGKPFLPISCVWKIALTWILVGVFAYFPSFISQILDFLSFWWFWLLFLIAWQWKPAIGRQYWSLDLRYSCRVWHKHLSTHQFECEIL